MARWLVSFLGLGRRRADGSTDYDACHHAWGGRVTREPTRLVQRALDELLGPFDEIVIFGTSRVEERWFRTGSAAALLGRPFRAVTVPEGGEPDQLWTVFRRVLEAFAGGGEGGGPPSEVVLDVTHGFRNQPMIALGALLFAVSEWHRRGLDPLPSVRVVYGAHEAGGGSGPPLVRIWDLTEIVQASRWNAALDALLRYGRADEVEALARTRYQRERESRPEQAGADPAFASAIRAFGKRSRELADDLALGRLESLLHRSAPGLRRVLESEHLAAWRAERLPVLEGAVDSLAAWLDAIALPADRPILGVEGLKATVALAELYLRLQRYAELAALLREGLVALAAHHAGDAPLPDPGPAWDESRWRAHEARLQAWAREGSRQKEAPGEPLWVAIGRLASEVMDIRNDVEHLSLRQNPRGGRRLRKGLSELVSRYRDLVERVVASGGGEEVARPGVEDGAVSAGGCFVNLTNHPSAAWPREQREAALARAGRIEDLPFPRVAPGASTDDVRELARDVLGRLPADAVVALVQGEFTLTLELVAELQRRGIPCLAATTEREAVTLEEGVVVRRFVFRGFREYPPLVR